MREIIIKLPNWLNKECKQKTFSNDKEKMEFVINLTKINVENGGGPFGAAIFSKTGKLISCGVNLVLQNRLSVLHAEIVAFLTAQTKLNTYDLSKIGDFELFSSSEPCAMCLGACLWSGVKRVVFGAESSYAREIGFDEGPVFNESWEYLKRKGIKVEGSLLKEKAIEILHLYKNRNGIIY
ncbi:nucleoside deaminase [Hippea alviniae]|uniref:nucleoside deaminase n=1 Tax=Hippea alviniae TaxID=1279027 RepID=UPI000429F932|nr:nucleoside deaminase [Hippea alviniae]